ncbi:hypothetical protein SESBI_41542 [Sesbania bispinosa]|nr:hypothetical protein SESBI_41542 [Sesbania bispinosa]
MALTGEEKDQLDRSTKKAKNDGASQDIVIVETQECEDGVVAANPEEIFPTSTGEGLKRKPVSYRDACIGINGANVDYYSSDWESNGDDEPEEEFEDDIDMETGDSDTEVGEPGRFGGRRREADPLCPVIKVTKSEIRDAR